MNTTAPQAESPAFIREATIGIHSDTDDCKSACVALDRIILKNRSNVPITGYRLGWVIGFAGSKRPAEVHLSNYIGLFKAIGSQQEREFTDNLVPLVQTSPSIKSICYFVVEVEQNGHVITEDNDKMALDQYRETWASQ